MISLVCSNPSEPFVSIPSMTVFCFLLSTDCAVEGEGETSCGRYEFEDAVFSVKRGDYAFLMEKVSQNLEKAKVCVTAHKQQMLNHWYFVMSIK